MYINECTHTHTHSKLTLDNTLTQKSGSFSNYCKVRQHICKMYTCDWSQLSVKCSFTLLSLLQTTGDDQVDYEAFTTHCSLLQHSIQHSNGV